MKSLVTLLTYHLLFASLLIFIIVSGNLPIYDIVLLPVFVPALNKGLTYLKIDSQKTRILNLALFFMILFYLMTLGNFIPFVLAYKYPQMVAFGYPIIIFLVSLVCSFYVTTQTKKTGIAAIDPDMLSQKEKKLLRNPGLKAGLVYGIAMFFGMPLLNILMDDSKSYLTALLNTRSILSTIVAAFFFGLTVHIVVTLRIQKAKEDQDDD